MNELVQTSHAGAISTITLNRPKKMNALNIELMEALVRAGEALAERPGLRAVILRGADSVFSTGLDVSAMGKIAAFAAEQGGITRRSHGASNLFQRVSTIWADLPVPVIAAIEGYAFGGGLQIALGADMRVAAPTAKLSVMEAKWGLVPDMGGMVAMRRLLRRDVMARLIYTAEVIDGRAALDYGLVSELAEDPLARAHALGEQIASRSPDAIRAAKGLVNAAAHLDDAALLLAEARAQEALIGGANQMEAVMAGFEKRAPNFRD